MTLSQFINFIFFKKISFIITKLTIDNLKSADIFWKIHIIFQNE